MIGNKNAVGYDEFAKRATASTLLKRDDGDQKVETNFEKIATNCDRADASRDPDAFLVDSLQKSATAPRPISSTSSQLCKQVVDDQDKPAAGAAQAARRTVALAALRAKLSYRDAMGVTVDPEDRSYDPKRIDHPHLLDIARDLHNALQTNNVDGLNVILDTWIDSHGYQDEPELKAVVGDPDPLRKRLITRGSPTVATAAGLLRP